MLDDIYVLRNGYFEIIKTVVGPHCLGELNFLLEHNNMFYGKHVMEIVSQCSRLFILYYCNPRYEKYSSSVLYRRKEA